MKKLSERKRRLHRLHTEFVAKKIALVLEVCTETYCFSMLYKTWRPLNLRNALSAMKEMGEGLQLQRWAYPLHSGKHSHLSRECGARDGRLGACPYRSGILSDAELVLGTCSHVLQWEGLRSRAER